MSPEASALGLTSVLGPPFWIATALFVISYAIIVSERVHKTVVAVVGASLMIVLKVLDQHEAFHVSDLGVDWNVIFLLVSMMIIINIMRPTGVFEYVAIKSAKWARGDPYRILVNFAIIAAALSALLDNVTTVLLISPVTILIAEALEVDPIPYLMVIAFASNIGGTATLIGDPPNIMIASKAHLNFVDFIYHLTPVIVIAMGFFLLALKLIWGRKLMAAEDLKARIIKMDEKEAIKDPLMVKRSLFVLGGILAGFVFHGALGFEPATIAFFGAGVLMLFSKADGLHHILAEVEWPTIFFFIGLFIIVGGVIKVGLVRWMSSLMIEITQGDMFVVSMAIMWFSAFTSAIIDNIPYVATMTPLVVDMARQMWPGLSGPQLLQHPDIMPVWWSLALGACLGGNGSAIGASANVIVVGMAERAGKRISFMHFMKYGMPVMVMTLVVSTVYVWVRYYLFTV